MDKDKRKSLELNIAIVLAMTLLVAVTIIFVRPGQKKMAPTKEIEVKRERLVSKMRAISARVGEARDLGYPKKESPAALEPAIDKEDLEEGPEVTILEDLDLDSITEEDREAQEQEEPKSAFSIHPSLEDMKNIRQKDLVIY